MCDIQFRGEKCVMKPTNPAWRWDGVDFEFLSVPGTNSFTSLNNRSCVLRISGFHNTLLAGDIESEQESRLLTSLPDSLPATVLLAPHHGSTTSSTLKFLQAVDPDFSIFTVGKGNRWNFPKQEVLEVYEDIGSGVLRTDQQGAITIYSNAQGIRIETYRSKRNRLWY